METICAVLSPKSGHMCYKLIETEFLWNQNCFKILIALFKASLRIVYLYLNILPEFYKNLLQI
jgi:hypothetical protein